MIEFVNGLDQQIVLWFNNLHNPTLDTIMWSISSTRFWIPLFVALLILMYKKHGLKKGFLFLLFLAMAVGMADYICSGIMKPYFERPRPSHEPALEGLLHFYTFEDGSVYRGGQYGFASSHAGNFFAIAMFCSLGLRSLTRQLPILLFTIAVIVSISRMYLAVHYPTDLIVGGTIGMCVSLLVYKAFHKWILKE